MSQETEGTPAAAIVEWINTFDCISRKISGIEDLSDGLVLLAVVSDISMVSFSQISDPKRFGIITDVGNNWVLKFNNLKKLEKLVSRCYEEILNKPFTSLPNIDLTAIGKHSNVQEIIQLCKYILAISVLCPKNSKYIQALQMMNEAHQEHLKDFIEEIQILTESSIEPQETSNNYTQNSYGDDGTYQSQSELARISKEKDDLESQYRELIDKHSVLLTRYDELENEKEDLQGRLSAMDSAVAQANETGRADLIMRAEIDYLKKNLQKSEDTRQEQERILETQSREIRELTHRNEDLERCETEAATLRDQVDEHRHTAEKLQRAENVIEKYKKKMEETADLKKNAQLMKDQYHSLLLSNQKLEEDYAKVLAFATLMESYKEQITRLEAENSEIVREKNKKEYDIAQCNKKMANLEADKARDLDRIQALEDHLQEVQLGMSTVDPPTLQRAVVDDPEDMDIDDYNLNDSLEESLKESNVTELKLSKRRLERQVKTLQEEKDAGGRGASQKVIVLQHLLEDANRVKSQFEKKYLQVSQERDILQSDMARIREGIPDAILDQSEKTLSLRLHIIELEKETKSLNETIAKLEQKIAEGRFNGDDEDMDDVLSKYNTLEIKLSYLEEQNQKQLQDINKLLLEKDILQGRSLEQKDVLLETERVNRNLKDSLAAFKAKDDEPFKQMNVELQQQLIQLQEDLHSMNTKLKKSKEFIKKQNVLLSEVQRDAKAGNFDEAVNSLKAEVGMRDEQVEKYKRQLYETRTQFRREQQLMVSAWYDMARRTNKDVMNHKTSPISWLGQQRRTLDNQLKRR